MHKSPNTNMDLYTDILQIIVRLAPLEFLNTNRFFSSYSKRYLLAVMSFQEIVETGKEDLTNYAIEYYKIHRHNPSMFAVDKYKYFQLILPKPVRSEYLRIDLNSVMRSHPLPSLIPLYKYYLEYVQEYYIMYDVSTDTHNDFFTSNEIRWKSSKKRILHRIVEDPNLAKSFISTFECSETDTCFNIKEVLENITLNSSYHDFLEHCLVHIPEIFHMCLDIHDVCLFDLLDTYNYDFTLCDSDHYNEFPGLFDNNPQLLIKFLQWEWNGKKWYPNKAYRPSNITIYVMSMFRPEIKSDYFDP